MNRQKRLVENTVNAFTISMAWKGKKFITVKSDLAKSIVEQSSAAQTTGKLIKKTIDLHYSSLNGARDHSLKALDQYQQLLTKIKSTSEPLMREMIRLEVQYKEAGIKAGAYIGKEEQERMKVLFEKISTANHT